MKSFDFYKISKNGEEKHLGSARAENVEVAWDKLNCWNWAKKNGVEGKNPYSDDITFISQPVD